MQQRRSESYAPENRATCHSAASHIAVQRSMSRCSTLVTVPLTPTVTTGPPVVAAAAAAAAAATAGGWLPLAPGGCGVTVGPMFAGTGSPAQFCLLAH